MSAVTARQVRDIHVLKSRAGLSEADYRAALGGFGVATSKDLTADQAEALKTRLQGALNGAPSPTRRPAETVAGPYAGKLRALWLAGWNLGVVRDRTDAALLSFVERQTGLSHTRFLRDPADARRAIEALKRWLAREAGVDWPKRARQGEDRMGEVLATKRAVIAAQHRRLAAHDARQPDEAPDLSRLNGLALDRLSAALGRRLRAALTLTGGPDHG